MIAVDSDEDDAYTQIMGRKPKPENAPEDLVSKVSVEAWDYRLHKLSQQWVLAYKYRQIAAELEGVTTPPPEPPKPPGMKQPAADVRKASEKDHPRSEASSGPANKLRTLGELALSYQTDPNSPYRTIGHTTRGNYDRNIRRLVLDFGSDTPLSEINKAKIDFNYEHWTEGGKITMGHSLATMFRQLMSYGASAFDDPECVRLSVILRSMRFQTPKADRDRITEQQVNDFREAAHKLGFHSMALAQAFQWEHDVSQREVIGTYAPLSEPGNEYLRAGDAKWIAGFVWEEMKGNTLRYVAGKTLATIDLTNSPMVLEELARGRKSQGPMIVYEKNQLPYKSPQFRTLWRKIADAAGIPKHIRNMDSRNDVETADQMQRTVETEGSTVRH